MTSATDQSQEYTVRVAYLHSQIENRARSQQKPSALTSTAVAASASTSSAAAGSKRPHDTILALDLGSLLGRDSTRSPKYPEKLLKIVDGILQRIAMGQESKYSDQRFRRTCALFWSSVWAEKAFQRQMKDSRKVEDLILAFVTTSTKTLKKEDDMQDGAWKEELGVQVSLFLDIISDALLIAGPISNELANRLSSYQERMRPTEHQTTNDPSNLRVQTNRPDKESINSGRSAKGDIWESLLMSTVGRLYGLSDSDLQHIIRELQVVCSEQAALDDLKNCLKLLNTDNPYPYGPKSFADQSFWATWKATEVATLSQTMLSMMQSNPALTQSSDRSSLHELTAKFDDLGNESMDHVFTFIPLDARAAYRQLLSRCLDWDLELLQTLPEDEDVSLGILSTEHMTLLSECSMRWRLPATFRTWTFASSILDRFERGQVPSVCVHEAMAMMDKVRMESSLESWALEERQGFEATLSHRDYCFLAGVEQALASQGGYHSMEMAEAVEDWRTLGVFDIQLPALRRVADSIKQQIQNQAIEMYRLEGSTRLKQEGTRTPGFVMQLAGWVEKDVKRLNKRFPDAITSDVDLVPLVLRQHLQSWFQELTDIMLASPPLTIESEMEESFSLLRKALKLADMGDAFSSETPPIQYPIKTIFERHIYNWLDQTALKTKQWTDQALAIDTFGPSFPNGPSSSVTDLFDSYRSAIDFLLKLNWPDQAQLADFATRLAKTISLSISDYCNKIEQLFAKDMHQGDSSQATAQQRAWVEKARATLASLQGERRLQAFFNFSPESCVKLNNIESARQELDKLYEQMGVDQLAEFHQPRSSTTTGPQTFLFTVKVVLAEGLSTDGNSKLPDAFVILSDEHGTRYAKTRTIYDDTDPRWDESFDIPAHSTSWFMATVRHRTLAGKHNLLGRAYLRLDPSQFMDLISKDFLLPLDTKGHILFRVSMEGERDDLQFHFGRAFRWLKRTESDMMSPVLRHTLSRAAIKSVIKPNNSNPLDYNEALGKLSAAYRSAIGTLEYKIPATKDELRRGPTDAEIETAIHPLFDYLDTNIHTLASTLSSDAMQMVMNKLWKQILATVESLIVPPISDKPSHMRALADNELDVALKWLKFLRDFFYAGGDPSGVPLTTLQNQKFNEILSIRIYYDWSTDDLMEECIRGFQSTLKYRALKPSKTLLSQRNLGTIRARKMAKRALLPNTGANTEMIMRILRMRSGTQEFLAQQIQTLSVVKLTDTKSRKGNGEWVTRR